jgi:ABC-type multidrug transport system ATPase subunit
VGLSEKAHCVAATLSGGQRRKLSLGIALIGDSKVIIFIVFNLIFIFILILNM